MLFSLDATAITKRKKRLGQPLGERLRRKFQRQAHRGGPDSPHPCDIRRPSVPPNRNTSRFAWVSGTQRKASGVQGGGNEAGPRALPQLSHRQRLTGFYFPACSLARKCIEHRLNANISIRLLRKRGYRVNNLRSTPGLVKPAGATACHSFASQLVTVSDASDSTLAHSSWWGRSGSSPAPRSTSCRPSP